MIFYILSAILLGCVIYCLFYYPESRCPEFFLVAFIIFAMIAIVLCAVNRFIEPNQQRVYKHINQVTGKTSFYIVKRWNSNIAPEFASMGPEEKYLPGSEEFKILDKSHE